MKNTKQLHSHDRGFSLFELVVVIAVMLIVMAFALPNVYAMLRSYRTTNDARSITAQLSLARMRAASKSTPTRLNFNLAANTFQLEVCASLCNQSAAIYVAEGGTQYLSQGNAFGFGSLKVPAGGQTTIAQTPQITFNSRGVSVDSFGNAIGTAAIYITNNQGMICAVTVSVGGQPTAQEFNGTWNTQEYYGTWRLL
jgi:prepilin-type N-terminal cleavage/methylation domain-containing protein